MNSKERLLNSIKGIETDRLAWSPFLPYFWEAQPEEVRKKGMLEFYRTIGADPLFRGFCTLIKKSYKNCEFNESVSGLNKKLTMSTPIGSIAAEYTYSPEGDTWFLTGYPLKSEEDFKILTYINEDMEIIPDFSKYEAGIKKMGEEALLIPILGSEMKSSYQSIIENWAGTEEAVYAAYDFPETLDACLESMKRNSIKSAEYAVQCEAEAYIFWEDSSTGNISPEFFRKYVAPEISEWADIIHGEDKYLVHHACGLIRDLVVDMKATGIDAIESVTPPPTGNIYTYEVRDKIGEDMVLIGGIEPTVLLNYGMDELRDYVVDVIEKTGKRGFILGNADSCPPGVDVEKFKMISKLVKEMA